MTPVTTKTKATTPSLSASDFSALPADRQEEILRDLRLERDSLKSTNVKIDTSTVYFTDN